MKFNVILILVFYYIISSISATARNDGDIKCDSKNCVLPLCKCSDTEPPGNMDLEDVPMMIGLSFNGIVASHHMKYIKTILNPIFKNPNGCPTQATFFVSDKSTASQKTDYCVVQNLFDNNNEIGVGSVKYK